MFPSRRARGCQFELPGRGPRGLASPHANVPGPRHPQPRRPSAPIWPAMAGCRRGMGWARCMGSVCRPRRLMAQWWPSGSAGSTCPVGAANTAPPADCWRAWHMHLVRPSPRHRGPACWCAAAEIGADAGSSMAARFCHRDRVVVGSGQVGGPRWWGTCRCPPSSPDRAADRRELVTFCFVVAQGRWAD